MAKSQTQAATQQAGDLYSNAASIIQPVVSGIGQDKATAQTQAGRTFGEAESGYQQQQTTGGFDPIQLANLRTTLSGMQPTGGYDPTQLANLRGQYGTLQDRLASMAPSGGYDPEQLAKTLGGYGAMADTGGFTEQDRQNFLNRATSGSTTTASNLAAAAARNAAATGGYAGSALANIQRQAGQQQADATTAALTSLNQQINANKFAGLGGLGTTEAQLAAARQGITGQQAGVAGQQAGLEGGVASGSRDVAGLQSGLESGVAGGVRAANAGLAGLSSQAQTAATAAQQQILQALGLQFGTQAQSTQIMQELSKNPGLFQTLIGDLGTLGGAAGGVLKGLAGLTKGGGAGADAGADAGDAPFP